MANLTTETLTSQSDKFRDLAPDLGCHKDEAACNAKRRKIAKTLSQHQEKAEDGR